MRIFIPTTATESRLFTHNAFAADCKTTWMCHTLIQAERIAAKVHTAIEDIIVTHADDYIGQLAAIRKTLQVGEWYIKADDNIRAFIGTDGNVLSGASAWGIINEAVSLAEKRGARLVGFAPVDNPFFRKTIHRDVGFCVGKMYAEKYHPLNVPMGEIKVMDDYERTAQHLYRHGRVLVDNRLHSRAKHYEEGGIGSWDTRLPQKLLDCQKLVDAWYGLYRFKHKSGKDPKSEIQLRFTNLEQVEAWRMFVRKQSRDSNEFTASLTGKCQTESS